MNFVLKNWLREMKRTKGGRNKTYKGTVIILEELHYISIWVFVAL